MSASDPVNQPAYDLARRCCVGVGMILVGWGLIGCGPPAKQVAVWKEEAAEREELSRQLSDLQTAHDRQLALRAHDQQQLSKVEDELAAIKVDEFMKGGQIDNEKASLIEVSRKQQATIEALRKEIERLKVEKEEIISGKREARRQEMIGTEIGTLLVGEKPYFKAKILGLTAAWIDLDHRDGSERILLERVPDRLQKRFLYHAAEAAQVIEAERLRKVRALAVEHEQKRIQAEAAIERARAVAEAKVQQAYRARQDKVRGIKDEIDAANAIIAAENQRHAEARAQGKISNRSNKIRVNQEKLERLSNDLRKAMVDLRLFEVENGLL